MKSEIKFIKSLYPKFADIVSISSFSERSLNSSIPTRNTLFWIFIRVFILSNFNVNNLSVNNGFFWLFRNQNWNRNIFVNRNLVSNWNFYTNILIIRNSYTNSMINSSCISGVYWFTINCLSISINRFSLYKFNFSINCLLDRLSNLLSIDSSSWNSIVHSSIGLSGLNR